MSSLLPPVLTEISKIFYRKCEQEIPLNSHISICIELIMFPVMKDGHVLLLYVLMF